MVMVMLGLSVRTNTERISRRIKWDSGIVSFFLELELELEQRHGREMGTRDRDGDGGTMALY